MNSLQRCELAAIFFSALMLFAVRASTAETTIAGKVGNVDTANQSFELKATAKHVKPGTAEVKVSNDTDFVNAAGLADLRIGDKVQVQSEKTAAGQIQADRVRKV